MIRNIFITAISIAVVTYCIRTFKNWKYASQKERNIVPIVFLLWSVMVGIPNIPFIIAPISPPVTGKVEDAVTGKPIANSYIKANWEIEQLGLAGGHWETYYQLTTKSDAQGEFHVPRHMKPLGIYGLLPLFLLADHYNGLTVQAHVHGYKSDSKMIPPTSQLTPLNKINITISLRRHTPDSFNSTFLENDFKSTNCPYGSITEEDKQFLQDDNEYVYNHFDEIFKQTAQKEVESALIQIGHRFDDAGNYTKAIEVYQRMKANSTGDTSFEDQKIEQLTRNLTNQKATGKSR